MYQEMYDNMFLSESPIGDILHEGTTFDEARGPSACSLPSYLQEAAAGRSSVAHGADIQSA